jgi:NADH-quinone oxidoreductase subunit I
MTDIYDLSSYTRKSWVLDKDKLTQIANDFIARRGKEKFDEKSAWREDQKLWPEYDKTREKLWDFNMPRLGPNYQDQTA